MFLKTKTLGSSRILPLVLVTTLLMVFTYFAFALPSITYISPTLSDNATTGSNWVFVNVTSSENLNQSLLEWGNQSGFTNVSMGNSSLTNWYANMTNLADRTYNYTIFMQNTMGNWNQTGRRFVTIDTTAPYSLYACQDLTIAGGSYILVQNVSSAGTCFNVLANNVTLDGAGFTVNYSQSVVGYGVNITGRNNVTVKNLNVVQGNSSVASTYGIYGQTMTNSTIVNNTVTTSGSNGHGIYLYSSSSNNNVSNNTVTTTGSSAVGIEIFTSSKSNIISSNNITSSGHGMFFDSNANQNVVLNNNIVSTSTYGIYLYGANNNSISGGSIISRSASSYDYYLRTGAGSTNNFTNTNFTALRRIYFYDSSVWFNYNNQTNGNIWLKTNVSAASREIRRTLITWSQSEMKWNDTNYSGAITANYNLLGLLSNANYSVYNTSAGVQTNPYVLTTDAGGNIQFNISLNGNTEIKVTTPQPPSYSLNSTNSTVAGTSVLHSLYWTADNGLSAYIFSFDNCTGNFVNQTYAFSGAGNWSNVTKTINSTVGCTMRWKVYANDTVGNMTESPVFSYNTTTFTDNPPTYSSVGTNNTLVNQSTLFYAYWQDDIGLSGFIFSTNNNGTWVNDSWQPFTGTGNWSNATKVLNSTSGVSVGYRFYVNDTTNQWNNTGIRTLVTTNGGSRNWYVATYGNNANDGLSVDTPKYNFNNSQWFNSTNVKPGDTVYLINGTWYNETIWFTGTNGIIYVQGNSTHPVTVTAYNGTPTFDGVDSASGKYGVYAYPNSCCMGYVNISNINIINQDHAIVLRNVNYSTIYNVSASYAGINENLIHLTDVDNLILDSNDFGAIGNGYNSLSFISISRNVTNNIIRNNRFHDNFKHGLIDLQNAAITDTTVSVRDMLITNNQFYDSSFPSFNAHYNDIANFAFSNISFINNNITNITSASSNVILNQLDDSLIQNNTITLSNIGFGTNSVNGFHPNGTVTIKDNIVDSTATTAYWFYKNDTYPGIVILQNNRGTKYRSEYGKINVVDPVGNSFTLVTANNGIINFNHSDGIIFTENGANTTYYFPDRSEYTTVGNETVTITTYNMTARPSTGYLNITVNQFNSTLDRYNITVNSSVAENPTWFNLTAKNANAFYNIKRDGSLYATIQSGADKVVRFFYNATGDDWSAHTFEFSPGISVSLNSPLDTLLTSNATQIFNCSASSGSPLVNITLYTNQSGWSAKNSTNITGTSNSSQWINTLTDGIYLWNCLTYDNTGNSSYAQSNYTLTIDTTPPMSITNLQNQSSGDSWIYWNWTNPADFNHTEIWLNGTFQQNISVNYFNATGLSGNTQYQIQTRTADNAGNINTTWVNSTAKTITDTTPPTITIQSPSNTTYNKNWVWANVTLDKSGPWCGISLNSTANQTLSNTSATAWYLNLSIPSQGSNNVIFWCNSTNGYMGNSSTVYFTVDTIPPAITVNSPTNNTNYSATSIWFNASVYDATTGVNWTGYSLDGSANITMTNSSGNWNNNNASMAQGLHSVVFYANDSAGNTNQSSSYAFRVDTIAPSLLLVLPANTTYNSVNRTLNYTATDTNSGVNTIWYQYNGTNTTVTGNTTFTALNNQQSNLTLYANDSAGNINSTSVFFTIDAVPPVLTFVSPTPNNTQANSSWAYVNITSSKTLSAALLEWNLTQNITMQGSGTNWYYNKTMANGNYTFKVYANDSANNWNVTETRWVYANYTSCAESWTYSGWSSCSGGTQTRTATDANNCGTTVNQSALSQSCSSGSSDTSGSSGSSGSSSSSSTATTKSITATPAGMKIIVNLKQELSSPSITAAQISSIPVSAPSEPVYQYINITKNNFNNSQIENATIEFNVNKSWFIKNNITSVYLARYENGWNKLKTELINSTSAYNSYRAYTNSFSYFAIIGETRDAKSLCTENWSCSEWSDCKNDRQARICKDLNNCNTTLSKPEDSQACKVEKPTVKLTELPVFYIAIAAVGIIAILAGIIYITKPKKRKRITAAKT